MRLAGQVKGSARGVYVAAVLLVEREEILSGLHFAGLQSVSEDSTSILGKFPGKQKEKASKPAWALA